MTNREQSLLARLEKNTKPKSRVVIASKLDEIKAALALGYSRREIWNALQQDSHVGGYRNFLTILKSLLSQNSLSTKTVTTEVKSSKRRSLKGFTSTPPIDFS